MTNQQIRIIKKNNIDSMEYEIGDIFTVDSTWYGGANVTSKLGIPLSLDREEYEEYEEAESIFRPIDQYSYYLGTADAFCEMLSAGVKTLAFSHTCDSVEERAEYLEEVKKICNNYGVYYYPEDQILVTDLFSEEAVKGKYIYLFYRLEEVLEQYLDLKEMQKTLMENGAYTKQSHYEISRQLGKLLSYPEDMIEQMIQKNAGTGQPKEG